MRLRLIGVLGVTGLLFAGCGTGTRTTPPAPIVSPEQPAEPAPPPGPEIRPYVPPSAPVPQQARPAPNRAVQVLMARSEDQLRDGELAGAAASLERAIRIAPRDPEPWHRLARVRERQGQYGQAEDLASKSNALAGSSQPELSRDNWLLIARCRRAVGDLAGARAAERRAEEQQQRLR